MALDEIKSNHISAEKDIPISIGKIYIFSSIFVGIGLLFLWFKFHVGFETDDDYGIMSCLAGFKTGTPSACSLYSEFIWGLIVSTLYRITPLIPWYIICCLFSIYISLVVICSNIIIVTKKLWLGTAFFTGIFLLCMVQYTLTLNFTVTAAFCGCACASNILCESIYSKRWKIFNYIFSGILLLLSLNIRKSSGLIALSVAIVILFFKLFIEKKVKEGSILGCLVVSVFLISHFSNLIYEKYTGISEWTDFNHLRSQYIDYGRLPYQGNEEIYQSVGWSEKFYNLTAECFSMDEVFNKEALSVINAAHKVETDSFSGKISTGFALLQQDEMIAQIKIWLLVILLLAILKWKFKDHQMLLGGVLFLTFLAEILFIAYEGRFPARVYETFIIIFIVPSIIAMLNNLHSRHTITISTLLVLFAGLIYMNVITQELDVVGAISGSKNVNNTFEKLQIYAGEHHENVYVYDLQLSASGSPNPFETFEKGKEPYNLIFWGGAYYNSPIACQQIQKNGKKYIHTKDFLDDNVYICGVDVSSSLTEYMIEKYPQCKINIIENYEGVVIYKYSATEED